MLHRITKIVTDQGGVLKVAKKVLHDPKTAFTAGMRVLNSNWIKLLFDNPTTWKNISHELQQDGFLVERLSALSDRFSTMHDSQVRGRAAVSGGMRSLHAELIYAIVRTYKPDIVFETGVCNGVSSSVILHAMQLNDLGMLVSVDLPEYSDPNLNKVEFWEGKGGAVVPAGDEPGWLVPDKLRHRWNLCLGRSQDILKPLLREFEPIDVFIHDSEHSYDNQLFEFQEGFAALNPGGILIATDINWSDAFDEFWNSARKTGAKCAFVDPSCAIVIKAQ